MDVPPEHRRFADEVAAAKLQDPLPTFANLSAATGVPVEDLVHYALVRWVASGSELLMSIEPLALRQLVEARQREDWDAVAGIVDWLGSNP